MHFIYSVKGVYPPSAELTRCVRCDFSSWKGMGVHSLLTADFSLGVSCVPFLPHGCDIPGPERAALHRRSGAPRGRQGADVAFAPVPPRCLLVFSTVQRLWHTGMVQAQRCCPTQQTPGTVCSGGLQALAGVLRLFAVPSSSPSEG